MMDLSKWISVLIILPFVIKILSNVEVRSTKIVTEATPLLRKGLIGKPEVTRLHLVVLGVSIRWTFNVSAKHLIKSFIIEHHIRSVSTNTQWKESGIIDTKSTENTWLYLADSKDPASMQNIIEMRFRIVPKLKGHSSNQIQDSIKSEWSDLINFSNLLGCSISLDENPLFENKNSILTLNWQHNCYKAYQLIVEQYNELYIQNPMKYPDPPSHVIYSIFYQKINATNQKDARLSLVLKGNDSETLIFISSNENENQYINESGIFNTNSFIKGRFYSIGVYGEVRLRNSVSYYLPLSNIITIKITTIVTSPMKTHSHGVLWVLGSSIGLCFLGLVILSALCLSYIVTQKLMYRFTDSSAVSLFKPTDKHSTLICQVTSSITDLSEGSSIPSNTKNETNIASGQPILLLSPSITNSSVPDSDSSSSGILNLKNIVKRKWVY